MASVDKPQVVDITPIWDLSITQSRFTMPVIKKWSYYNSSCLLYIILTIQQECAPAHMALTQSALLPITLPDINRF